MPRPLDVDINSRGEVATYLLQRAEEGKVKKCKHLRLDHLPSGYYPKCELDWASKERATNVGGRYYSWPICPQDCPKFDAADNFIDSVSRDQYDLARVEKERKQQVKDLVDAMPESLKNKLAPPPKVTLSWLGTHVPVQLWGYAAFYLLIALVVTFFAGTLVGPLPWVERGLLAIGLLKQPLTPPTAPAKPSP
jgi:hypothetical protein